MRVSTISHIVERINHANKTHGIFTSPEHAIAQARIELMECEVATKHIGDHKDVIAELLDAAVVCIRAAEQFGGVDDHE